MQDLRLIGVHEDGAHVLLSDAEGKRYRVPLDEAMRAAARRDRPRLGQLQIEIDGGLRPRDVQSLIRSGLSTEEVADRAGWTVEKVQRFEGPVLAEREHIANQARACVIGTSRTDSVTGAGRGSVSSAGSEQTLGNRADERFKERGVPAELVRWDSSRLDDGQWTVTALFPAGGRERTASWRFDPRLRSLVPGNDEARWLSEESSSDSAIPTPHVATNANRASAVFDVEAEGGVEDEKPAGRAKSREPIDLMAAMREQSTRSRRGRRRSSPTHTPVEESPREDALPLEDLVMDTADAPEPPAARGEHPMAAHLDERAPDDDAPANIHHLAPSTVDDGIDDDPSPEPDETHDTEAEDEPAAEEPTATVPAAPKPAPRKTPGRKGRPSVPSWDDIMFGGGRGGNSS
ncbi:MULTISPECIES: septation protein SepH [unclassified Knoellia]|uniref:septation protein SepH n=1 Tax=Knoellia altitudinis TaxID=3404795 RepID=UPI003609EFDA